MLINNQARQNADCCKQGFEELISQVTTSL